MINLTSPPNDELAVGLSPLFEMLRREKEETVLNVTCLLYRSRL